MVIIACGETHKPLLHSYIILGGSTASVVAGDHLHRTSRFRLQITPPDPSVKGVVVMGKASEEHNLHLKYQTCAHILPQAPHWAPTGHYYNTGWPLGRWYGPGCRSVRTPSRTHVLDAFGEVAVTMVFRNVSITRSNVRPYGFRLYPQKERR